MRALAQIAANEQKTIGTVTDRKKIYPGTQERPAASNQNQEAKQETSRIHHNQKPKMRCQWATQILSDAIGECRTRSTIRPASSDKECL